MARAMGSEVVRPDRRDDLKRCLSKPRRPEEDEEHRPSCFGCEEEKGVNWSGIGGMPPALKEKRPTL
jgi:hypothetical protein